jgi:excisionase family DNA binding protein
MLQDEGWFRMANDHADQIEFPRGVIVVNPGSWTKQVTYLGQLLVASARSPEAMRVIPDASGRTPESTLEVGSPSYWSQHLPELADALRSAQAEGALWQSSPIPVGVGAIPESPTRLTWTVEEAAMALGISRAFAYDAVRRGEIPAIKIGRRILIPRSALSCLLESPLGGSDELSAGE